MSDRDNVYVQILHFGLMALRNAATGGDVQYWEIEATHLHNLPSLIGETNEGRHNFYFDVERSDYLERVDSSTFNARFTLARYRELWEQLDQLRSHQ